MILKAAFYRRKDVVRIATELIGKRLVTAIKGQIRSGIIVETEAYNGIMDRACHAYNNRRTKRTEIMYLPGGVAYVYLCYGIHSLFNIVTGERDNPQAVLIRGILMDTFRPPKRINGPGRVSKALGIHYTHSGMSLLEKKKIWLEESDFRFDPGNIKITTRIGVDYAGEDARLPNRFVLEI